MTAVVQALSAVEIGVMEVSGFARLTPTRCHLRSLMMIPWDLRLDTPEWEVGADGSVPQVGFGPVGPDPVPELAPSPAARGRAPAIVSRWSEPVGVEDIPVPTAWGAYL